MKRIIAFLLAAIMLGFALVSCAEPDNGDGETTTTADTGNADVSIDITEAITTEPYASDNGPLNYGGATVKILSRSNSWVSDEIWSDGIDGDPVNSAVFSRNASVENNLGIVIENDMEDGNQYAVSDKIKLLQQSNDLTYDFFGNSTYSTIMYTNLGLFANLKNAEHLELDKPWFSQNFVDVASVGDSLYLVTGSLALSMYRFIFATFFNPEMIESVGGEDLYDVVNEGRWTIGYQTELAEKIYNDSTGDGKTEDDTFGFITNGDQIGVDPYWSALKLRIIDKTPDNWYEVVLDTDRLAEAVNRINKLVWSKGSYSYKHTGSDAEQETIRAKFAEGGAAMATLRIIECESQELRTNRSYGILPMPKFSEKQDDYYSYAHDQITSFGIVSWLNDEQFQRAGAVLNEMNRQSIILVQPAYYELALKTKYLNDEKSWNMLDKIVTGLYLDAGVLYTKEIDSIHQVLRPLIGGNKNTVASTIAPKLSTYDRRLQDYMDKIKELQVAA